MPPESRAVKPKPKPSIWWRPLKIDGWGLFKAAVQVVKSLSAKQYDAAVKDALAVLETVKFKENDAHLAWALVYTAMTKAIANLLRSVRDETSAHVFERFAAQCARLDQELNANETAIDKAFFDHPGWSQYVREVTNKVRAGLIASELDEGSADTIARTLPQQFTLALDREWLRDKERYAKLLPENRRTPFSSAADHEDHWTVYAGWLEDEADRRVFDEDFGLSRVYIPLRAYVETLDRSGPKRTVGLVEEMLDAWLEAARTNDAIRIVEGDPGAGKSSLARRFAATRFGHQAAGQWWRAVYVPLHDEAFALGRSIEEAAAIFTQRVSDTKLVPLDRNAPHGTLLILDGLDELARGGQFGRDTIRAFMSQVTALLKAWNDRDSARLLVLICGRPVAVGEIKAEVRADEAVLNLLPFLVNPVTLPEWSTFPGTCSDPQKLLEADQRKDWYEAYSSARGLTNGAELYAKIQKREDLATVTAQPLLNYLIAFLTREEETGELPANLCGVYEALLHKVWQRRWDRGQVPAIGQMPFEPFCQLLETIALTAWHSGNARSIRVGEVEDHLTDAQKRQLEALEKDVKAGVLRLLFAFFLRPGVADRAGQTYEFTHKTFSEYLVARRLVREIDTLAKDWKESAGGRGWKDESRLQDWVELFGPTLLNMDMHQVLGQALAAEAKYREGLRSGSGQETALGWQAVLARLLDVAVRDGMPMHTMMARLKPSVTFREMNRQALYSEIALLHALNACHSITKVRSRIPALEKNPQDWMGGRWFRPMQFFMYSFADFEGTEWAGRSLGRLDLSGANLRRAQLRGANLQCTLLQRTDLSGVNLSWAFLMGADLSGANLSGADLSHAYLSGADLSGADLSGALNSTPEQLRATAGEPARMPNGKPPKKNWRAAKTRTRKKPATPTPEPPAPPAAPTEP